MSVPPSGQAAWGILESGHETAISKPAALFELKKNIILSLCTWHTDLTFLYNTRFVFEPDTTCIFLTHSV